MKGYLLRFLCVLNTEVHRGYTEVHGGTDREMMNI